MADPLEKEMEYRLEKRGVHVPDGVVQSLAAMARRVISDEISAAGFHRDRTITTAEELDALPDMSVVITPDGDALQKIAAGTEPPFVWINNMGGDITSSGIIQSACPVTAVWTPGEES